MANITKIETCKLKNKSGFNDLEKIKNVDRSTFWYYTSLSTLDHILDSKRIWVSNLKTMNDCNEATMHENCSEKVHALCFCHSDSEKIPLWYLYSGILGQGMRMGLTPSVMRKFISGLTFGNIYPIVKNGDKYEVSKTPFEPGAFDIRYGWVYYKKKYSTVKFRNDFYTVTDYDTAGFEEDNYFIKDYPWEYEKEFRIVFINKTSEKYDKIAVEIPEDIRKKLKLTIGPEASTDYDLSKKEWFKIFSPSQIKKSDLSVKMNLIERNKTDIIENWEQLIEQKNSVK